MRRLTSAFAFASAVLMAGCSSTGERAYYQTRYIPTSSDAAYSPAAKSRWRGDREIYELPGAPPAIGDDHRARRDCQRPGPSFPVNGVVAYRDLREGSGEVALQSAGGYDSRPVTSDGTGYADGPVMVAMGGRPPEGIGQRNLAITAGAFDSRPTTGQGPDTIPVQPNHATRDQDKWDYCLKPHAEAPPSRERGRAAPAAAPTVP